MRTNSHVFRLYICLAVISATKAAESAPAQDAPAFGWPFATATYNVTAAFDLDRDTGDQADWTGWRLGEATAGSGHAYDNHSGHDFGMATGTDLYAPARGRVNSLREAVPNDDHSDTGNYLILDHTAAYGNALGGKDYRTRYWHLAQNGVVPASTGGIVNKGSIIADSDNTGNSTGPHLHYAVSMLPNDSQTCAFYHGWWEHDEFYTGSTRPCLVYLNTGTGALNCREGASTAYNIITSFPPNTPVVATQRNGWWRVILPLPAAAAYEARTAAGGTAPGYTEAGTWGNWSTKSAVAEEPGDANRTVLSGSGSRTSSFGTAGNASDYATFNFTVPNQRGLYDVYATWPADANALGVTYRVTHGGLSTDMLVDQRGNSLPAGTGTKANPYNITRNPYVVNHTTVGAPDEWLLYTPEGSNLPQHGPENLYRLTLYKPGTVTITVDHQGYPTQDIDIHLLTAPNTTSCIQRADWTLTATNLAAGTYYIACDSYGTGAAGNLAATAYKLTVKISEDQPYPDSWVKVGQFSSAGGGSGTVQILEGSVTGEANLVQPGRIIADAIKIVPRITRRTGWVSDDIALRINTAATPVSSVVVKTDSTRDNDSDSMDEYAEVPIFEQSGTGTGNSSRIVGKAVTGQRFVCTGRYGDWYQVPLTNSTGAASGWILGDHLIGYRMTYSSPVADWQLYQD